MFTFTILDSTPTPASLDFAGEAEACAEVARLAEAEIIRLLAEDAVIDGGIAVEVYSRAQPAKRGRYGSAVEGWRSVAVGAPDGWGDYPVELACRLGVRLVEAPTFNLKRLVKFRATLRSPDYAANRLAHLPPTGVVETAEIAKAAKSYVKRALPWFRMAAVYLAATPEDKARLDGNEYGVNWTTGEIVYSPD